MDEQKKAVVLPPQSEPQRQNINAGQQTHTSSKEEPYIAPVEKQDKKSVGSEVTDGEDA
jgi:hypothetical protein